METFIQGFIMSFREGLEAFLIVMVLLNFLDKTKKTHLKRNVWYGLFLGISLSFVFGIILMTISNKFGGIGITTKLWESIASFTAVVLIISLIIWMIRHGSKIKHHIENKASLNLTSKGIMFITLFMVIREGAEIILFQFAGKYSTFSVIFGIIVSLTVTVLMYFSLIKVKLKTVFMVTLAYLILQSGFLLGYSVHEGLSAAKDMTLISSESVVFSKAYDLSETVFNHKEGIIGIPLYVIFGWYSKPEWIQFLLQYSLVFSLFSYWYYFAKKSKKL